MKTRLIRYVTCLLGLASLAPYLAHTADIYVRAMDSEYTVIQDAVDAAVSGDTIHIAPGVYVEQVAIRGKDITLQGQPGTIIRAFPNMKTVFENTSFNRCTMLLVDDSTDVILRNLTFEGDQLGNEQSEDFNGALFLSSGGVIEDCRFVGIRESVPGLRHCEAVEVHNNLDDAPHLTMDIRRNTIADCYSGIRLVGKRTGISLTISVVDNFISGVGPSAAWSDMEGIEVQEGMVGMVARNTVSHFSYVGDGANRHSPLAFGILGISTRFPEDLIELNPIRFENNTLLDNQLHFTLILCNSSTIQGNRIEGVGAGVRPAGLWCTGENLIVEENDFVALAEGIRVGGTDPDFGTVLGFGVNVLLQDNRFRDVATPVEVQPQATSTQGGTLIYPFPDPELRIAKSVLLSWPGYYENEYVLEGGSTPEGPWHEIDVTPQLVDGTLQASVEKNASQQYFRLQKP